jgi:hypothetical protein
MGHSGYFGYHVFLSHGYHASVFTLITTVTLFTWASMVAFFTMLLCSGWQIGGMGCSPLVGLELSFWLHRDVRLGWVSWGCIRLG